MVVGGLINGLIEQLTDYGHNVDLASLTFGKLRSVPDDADDKYVTLFYSSYKRKVRNYRQHRQPTPTASYN